MKNKIFNTAMMLFSRHGYDKVKIDDIVKYARVSKGTFYAYFPRKDSVLVECFNMIDEHYTQVFKTVSSTSSARERIQLFLETAADYCTNVCGMQVMKVVYMNQIGLHDSPPILRNKTRRYFSFLLETVRVGQKTGEFPLSISAEELTEFLARTVRSILYDWCLYNGLYTLKALFECHFHFLLELLSAKAALGRLASTDEFMG